MERDSSMFQQALSTMCQIMIIQNSLEDITDREDPT